MSQKAQEIPEMTQNILQNLTEIAKNARKQNVLFGIDGVVDEIYDLIDRRKSLEEYTLLDTMEQFSEKISEAKGSSIGIESIKKAYRTGGFTANSCESLATLLGSSLSTDKPQKRHHISVEMIGFFGEGKIKPLFSNLFEEKLGCKVRTYGNPAQTVGLEFKDGKVMLAYLTPLHKLDKNFLASMQSVNKWVNDLEKISLFGLGYWSTSPDMNGVYRYFVEEVFTIYEKKKRKDLNFFTDLADISKNPEEDIIELVEIFNQIPDTIRLVLSMNDREAKTLANALWSVSHPDNLESDQCPFKSLHNGNPILFKDLLEFLVQHITCKAAIIMHAPQFSLWYENGRIHEVQNAYTSKAKFTIAAGDTFNAGLCFGVLGGLNPSECLLIANAATSFFVRCGRRPTLPDLSMFLRNYTAYLEKDLSALIE